MEEKQYISTKEFAIKYYLAEKFVIYLCENNLIPEVKLEDGSWLIPSDYVYEKRSNETARKIPVSKVQPSVSKKRVSPLCLSKIKLIRLIISLFSLILAVIAIIVTAHLSHGHVGLSLLNGSITFAMGICSYFMLRSEIKLYSRLYPETNIDSFKIYANFIYVMLIVVYIIAFLGYVGVLIGFSYISDVFMFFAALCALVINILINLSGYLIIILASFSYNKAVLLENIRDNTKKSD